MQQSYDAMKIALRVLEALTERRYPDSNDVAILRDLAGSPEQSMGVDELACEVIQQALKHRAEARPNRLSQKMDA